MQPSHRIFSRDASSLACTCAHPQEAPLPGGFLPPRSSHSQQDDDMVTEPDGDRGQSSSPPRAPLKRSISADAHTRPADIPPPEHAAFEASGTRPMDGSMITRDAAGNIVVGTGEVSGAKNRGPIPRHDSASAAAGNGAAAPAFDIGIVSEDGTYGGYASSNLGIGIATGVFGANPRGQGGASGGRRRPRVTPRSSAISATHLLDLVELGESPMLVLDDACRVRYANGAAYRWLRLEPSTTTLIGQKLTNHMPAFALGALSPQWRVMALTSEIPVTYDISQWHSGEDASARWAVWLRDRALMQSIDELRVRAIPLRPLRECLERGEIYAPRRHRDLVLFGVSLHNSHRSAPAPTPATITAANIITPSSSSRPHSAAPPLHPHRPSSAKPPTSHIVGSGVPVGAPPFGGNGVAGDGGEMAGRAEREWELAVRRARCASELFRLIEERLEADDELCVLESTSDMIIIVAGLSWYDPPIAAIQPPLASPSSVSIDVKSGSSKVTAHMLARTRGPSNQHTPSLIGAQAGVAGSEPPSFSLTVTPMFDLPPPAPAPAPATATGTSVGAPSEHRSTQFGTDIQASGTNPVRTTFGAAITARVSTEGSSFGITALPGDAAGIAHAVHTTSQPDSNSLEGHRAAVSHAKTSDSRVGSGNLTPLVGSREVTPRGGPILPVAPASAQTAGAVARASPQGLGESSAGREDARSIAAELRVQKLAGRVRRLAEAVAASGPLAELSGDPGARCALAMHVGGGVSDCRGVRRPYLAVSGEVYVTLRSLLRRSAPSPPHAAPTRPGTPPQLRITPSTLRRFFSERAQQPPPPFTLAIDDPTRQP